MTPGSAARASTRALTSGQPAQPWAVNSSTTTGSTGASRAAARGADGWAEEAAANRAASPAAAGNIQPRKRMARTLITGPRAARLIFA